jgi:hypothetical protein
MEHKSGTKGEAMALEERGYSTYYYRSCREGKRVKRRYVAAGYAARLAAALDSHCRVRKRLAREVPQAAGDAWDAACGPLDKLIAVTDLLVTATLLAEGFHRHKQGEWRRRRETR